MKIRIKLGIVLLLGLLMLPAAFVLADDAEINVLLDGAALQFDVPAQIIDGRTMLPVRAIFEALGAGVYWDEERAEVTAATADGETIRMTIGSEVLYINGRIETMDVPPQIVDGRTLVPARFAAQAMGWHVSWLACNRTVYIGRLTNDFSDTRYLELINHHHPIRTEPDRDLLTSAWPDVAVRARDILLHQSALAAVGQMFDAATEEDVSFLFVSSGYRSFEEQAELYAADPGGNLIMPPGHSEYHSGLAVDILIRDIAMHHIPDFPQGRWMAANSWRFGLIQRYPESREDVTGIAFEPWHFRYVGQIHAWQMWERGMVLEEYIQFLWEEGGFTAGFNDREYTILHQMPVNGMIHIPHSDNFSVSSDNLGGYIITMRR